MANNGSSQRRSGYDGSSQRRSGYNGSRNGSRPRRNDDYDIRYTKSSRRESKDEPEEDRRGVGFFNVFLSILLIGALVGMYFLLHSSLFNISEINVIGCKRFSAGEIIAASGITGDTNFIELDKETAKSGIEQNPYLRVDKITRVFPLGVNIVVTERTPIAQILTVNGYYIINEEAVALGLNPAKDETIINILNFGIAEPTFGQTVVSDSAEKVAAVSAVLTAIKDCSLTSSITSIDVENTQKIELMYRNEFKIIIGDGATAMTKLARLETIVKQCSDKLTPGSVLNLETENGYYISGTASPQT